MKRSLVVGMMNAGKTVFCQRFAEFLGLRDGQWLVERTDGRTESRRVPVTRMGSGSEIGQERTRFLQSTCLEVKWRGRKKRVVMTDSAGLNLSSEESVIERASMAQTLNMLLDADIILHVIDANQVGNRTRPDESNERGLSTVDQLIASFASKRPGYVVLANKMDLPGGRAGYRYLCNRFSKQQVIPVSALHQTGFREVKQYVSRMA